MFTQLLLICLLNVFATPWTVAWQATVHGIFLATILEWVAISYSKTFTKSFI